MAQETQPTALATLQTQPFDDDDTQLREALDCANIPALMLALVHVTGDASLLRGPIQPGSILQDAQGGLDTEQQAAIRNQAFDLLRQYRDQGCPPAHQPDDPTLEEMLHFLLGSEPGAAGATDYLDYIRSELALDGDDPSLQPTLAALRAQTKLAAPVLVIGAGISGLLAGVRLKQAGIPHLIVDRNPEIGGTWHENRYPGCRVDSANHSYSYSFAPYDWPQHYSTRTVLQQYVRDVAEHFGVLPQVQLNTEVESANFNASRGNWTVTLQTPTGQRQLEASAIISAVGQLNQPKYPDLPGLSAFQGTAFHSARWPADLDLRGKRVAVIGTGASAFQIVPEIAEQAASVKILQRTPPWVLPTPDYHDDIPSGKHWLLRHIPGYARWYRFLVFWRSAEGLLGAVQRDPAWQGDAGAISLRNDRLRKLLSDHVRASLEGHEELISQCIPDYPVGAKRALRDNGVWFDALKRDDVELLTTPVRQITTDGLELEDGRKIDADVLIFATGFHASRFLHPIKIRGRDGRDLHENWGNDPKAYLGITVPAFPNLFLMYGPNTNIVVNGSIIFFAECQMRYILGCLRLLGEHDAQAMEVRPELHDGFNAEIDAANAQMAWGTPGVSNWYKNDQGRVTQNWPYSMLAYWLRTRTPDAEDFHFL
jgi:4-hydroxyacetophenone monooxygenase